MTGNVNNSKNNIFSNIKKLYIQGPKSAFILLIIVPFVIGITFSIFIIKGSETDTIDLPQEESKASGEKILFWTCSMHPQIKQNGPGRCPLCSMELIPMKEDSGGGDKASLTLGKRARHLASVKTNPVVYKNLTKSIYTVGKINYDESKISHVTSWIDGRIDKLYVNFTGTIVQKGEHLVYIYSPELVSTQNEYLIAYKGIKALQKSSILETAAGSISLLGNTRDRLLLWGITEDQIKKLEETQKAQSHLTIYAPNSGTVINKNIFEGMYVKTGDRLFTIADLSRVWLYLDIYEYDIPWIRYGQDVEVATEAFPGEVFHGTVVFIDPFLDEDTRAVRVRVNMDNQEGKLKPGMFASVVIKSKFGANGIIFDSDIANKYMCPMHPDIISDEPRDCPECGMDLERVGSGRKTGLGEQIDDIKLSILNKKGVLAVPHSAVLYTGLRNVVYVEIKEGNYVPREVELGPKADEYYYVISGLKSGERVVTSGNFLIDSQMQLLGKPSLLFPQGSEFKPTDNKKVDESLTVISKKIDLPQFRGLMSEIFESYFSIREKLANDSIEGIKKDISTMEENVNKITSNNPGLPNEMYQGVKKKFHHTNHYLADMKGKTLDEIREVFKNISKNLKEYVEEFHNSIKNTKKAYIFYCPMVDASWLQENGEIGNPYYGAKMLKCGTLEKEIP